MSKQNTVTVVFFALAILSACGSQTASRDSRALGEASKGLTTSTLTTRVGLLKRTEQMSFFLRGSDRALCIYSLSGGFWKNEKEWNKNAISLDALVANIKALKLSGNRTHALAQSTLDGLESYGHTGDVPLGLRQALNKLDVKLNAKGQLQPGSAIEHSPFLVVGDDEFPQRAGDYIREKMAEIDDSLAKEANAIEHAIATGKEKEINENEFKLVQRALKETIKFELLDASCTDIVTE